jgi:hypothetical protein
VEQHDSCQDHDFPDRAGGCALTGEETDGVTVPSEIEQPAFLSWKAFRQLVTTKAGT